MLDKSAKIILIIITIIVSMYVGVYIALTRDAKLDNFPSEYSETNICYYYDLKSVKFHKKMARGGDEKKYNALGILYYPLIKFDQNLFRKPVLASNPVSVIIDVPFIETGTVDAEK